MKTVWGSIAAAALSPLAVAHDGHGLSGPHAHGADGLGWLALAAVVVAALWLARRSGRP
jgi:hypothetical protein